MTTFFGGVSRASACSGGEQSPPPRASKSALPSVYARPRASSSGATLPVMAIQELVDEVERSYRETQERLSDPAVYNDHREAADVGRRLKELEAPFKLAEEWRGVREDLDAAQGDGDLRELIPELEGRLAALEENLKLSLVESDPADRKDVLVEIRQGVGGDEAGLWAGDLYRMLTRYAERRGFKTEVLSLSESEGGGFKEVTFAVKGDGAFSIFKWEGGTHRVQRVPADRVAGSHPHVDRDRRRHARGRGGRGRDRPERAEDRRLPLDRAGRAERQHDRLRRSHHPLADRPRRGDAGREVAAPEQGEGDARAAGAPLRARAPEAARASRRRTRRSQIGTGERAEKIRTYNFAESRVTDHRIKLTQHRLDAILDGELDEFTEAIASEDRRRALETRDLAGALGARPPRSSSRRAARRRASTPSGCSRTRSGVTRSELYADGDHPLTAEDERASRARRPPRTARATGVRARRMGLPQADARVDSRVLIPRPETESSSSAASSCSTGCPSPVRARCRRRLRRDCARDRRRASRRARRRRPTARRCARRRRRESPSHGVDGAGRARRGRALRRPGGPVRPRRLEPAVRCAGRGRLARARRSPATSRARRSSACGAHRGDRRAGAIARSSPAARSCSRPATARPAPWPGCSGVSVTKRSRSGTIWPDAKGWSMDARLVDEAIEAIRAGRAGRPADRHGLRALHRRRTGRSRSSSCTG